MLRLALLQFQSSSGDTHTECYQSPLLVSTCSKEMETFDKGIASVIFEH